MGLIGKANGWFPKAVFATGLALATCLPTSLLAECSGRDIRPNLSASEARNIDKRVAEIPYSIGNHWRARRGDDVIHLIGTIHVPDPRLDQITERLRGVVEAAEVLFLEMTPDQEAALKQDMATRPELMFLQDKSLIDLMAEDDWASLSSALSARGIPSAFAAQLQPWYLSILLAMPPCLQSVIASGDKGLDKKLIALAEAADIRMEALEPRDTLFALFNDDPLTEQIDVMVMGLSIEDQSEDMLATLRASYFEEQHAQAWEISRWQMMQTEGQAKARLADLFDEMERDLLTTRNTRWIPVLLDALEKSDRIVAGFGAGHLSGEKGVLALLEAEGFTLERLPF